MLDQARKSEELTVFISYSRDDLAFADQLDAALKLYGFDTALDRHSISGGEEWKRRLGQLIRDADTVVFVLSPISAGSEICAWEVEEARRLGKRILPVVCRTLEGAAPPPYLSDLHFIFFFEEPEMPDGGFGTGLTRLVSALNTDFDWLREHTRLLARATDWEMGNQAQSRLLSGGDIAAAKAWVARRPKGAPAPTQLHLEFIRASEEEDGRRESAEGQRLRQIADAQAAREAALAEKEAAQKREAEAIGREAEASRRAVEESRRAAQSARRVAQRTSIGLLVSLALAVLAGTFGAYALNQKKTADVANASLESANKELAQANALAGAGRTAAEQAKAQADAAKREAVEAAHRLKASNDALGYSNAQLKSANALAEARREAAEKAMDLMLQQLVIKATFESVQAREPFRMSQVRAKGQDDEFQEALRLTDDPDEIWTRLARVLVEFAEKAPPQLRRSNKEREWAEHAHLIITRVVARRRTPEREALYRRIMDVLGRR